MNGLMQHIEYSESESSNEGSAVESSFDSDDFNSRMSSPAMISSTEDLQLSRRMSNSPPASHIGDLQLSSRMSFPALIELPASKFHMNLFQKRNYIAENRMQIMYLFQKRLSQFKEHMQHPIWLDLGNALDELIKDTKIDIVLEASYLYLNQKLPDIHDLTKRLSRMVLEDTKVQVFDESTPEKYQLADHESDTTYREDLAMIIRQIQYKRNQAVKQLELEGYKKERDRAEEQRKEAEKLKGEAERQARASKEALRRAEKIAADYAVKFTTEAERYENIDWEFVYTIRYRRKSESFTKYLHRMVRTKLSRLPEHKQNEWRQSGFPELVVMGLTNFRRVHALFLDLLDAHYTGFDSNQELINWFLYNSQRNKFSFIRRYK